MNKTLNVYTSESTNNEVLHVRGCNVSGVETIPVTTREEILAAAKSLGANRIMFYFGWMPSRAVPVEKFDAAMANRLWNHKPQSPKTLPRQFTQAELDSVADLIGN
jgi:hypothetical protein